MVGAQNRRVVVALCLGLLLAAAPAAAETEDAAACTPEDLVAATYTVHRPDGTTASAGRLDGLVRAGDRLSAALTFEDECAGALASLVTYRAPTPAWDRERADELRLHDSATVAIDASGAARLGPVHVPGCYFWVDAVLGEPLERVGPSNTTNYYGDECRLLDAEGGGEGACGALDCPVVELSARSGGDVHVAWTPVENASAYRIYRAVADGSATPELVAEVGAHATSFVDAGRPGGVTYRYHVAAVDAEGGESIGCVAAEITAIPVFDTIAATAAALLGGLGAMWMLRRRRA